MKKFFLLVLFLYQEARAHNDGSELHPADSSGEMIEVNSEVPQSDLTFQNGAESQSLPPARFGIFVSSWMPKKISINSYLPGTSEFKRTTVPLLGVEWLRSFFKTGWNWSTRFGFSYMRLSRSAPPSKHQSLYFVGIPLGMEAHWNKMDFWILSPYVQTNLFPSVAVTPRSVFEKGSTALGLFYDLKLGLQAKLKLFDPSGEAKYFFNLSGGMNGGSLRSSQVLSPFIEAGIQSAF